MSVKSGAHSRIKNKQARKSGQTVTFTFHRVSFLYLSPSALRHQFTNLFKQIKRNRNDHPRRQYLNKNHSVYTQTSLYIIASVYIGPYRLAT